MNGCLWNCRSAFYKLPFISQLFSDKELDFLMLSETWHAKSMPGKLDVFNATFLDYTKAEDLDVAILSKARGSGKRGGGVAFIFQASLNFTIYAIDLAEPTSFEYLSCKRKGVSPVVIVVIYRPPSVSFVTFLLEFERLLLALSDMTHPWIIAGDFNIKITDDTNHNTISFGNLISDYNCGLGLPNQPTHSGGNTLDFAVFSEDMSSRCSSLSVDNNESPSDHFPVLFKVDHPSTHSAGSYEYRKLQWYRNIRAIDAGNFKLDLHNKLSPLLENNESRFSSYLQEYNNLLTSVLDDHAPLLSSLQSDPRPPWIDHEYRSARALRNRLKNSSNRSAYNAQRRLCGRLITQKRQAYNSNLINSATDQGELFKVVNKIVGKDIHRGTLPSCNDNTVLADKFNDFFIKKVLKTRQTIPSVTKDPLLDYGADASLPFSGCELDHFVPTSCSELESIIRDHGVKTGPGDPFPPCLIKKHLSVLLPHFVNLVNLSLSDVSCDGIKEAHVVPILKSLQLDADEFKSYRPVSLLSFVSKLVERVVHKRINDHLSENNLSCPTQYGYKKDHSCETLLVKLMDDIMIGVDNKSGVVVLIVDLSAAFDTVDHDVLIKILRSKYHISGNALAWIKSFLSGRSQSVKIGDSLSGTLSVLYGVPQGSILGPLLFNLYCASIDHAFKSAGFDSMGYADDNLGLRCFPAFSSLSTLLSVVPNCIQSVNDWADAHFLKLNREKTQLMVFGDSQFRKTFQFDSFRCNLGSRIPISGSVKLLGFHIDSDLKFGEHVSSIVSSINYALRNLRPVRKFLSRKDAETIIHALITSKLDQCNSLLIGVSRQNLAKLQVAQNSALRYVLKLNPRSPVSRYYKELHWLTVEKRIYFKFLVVIFKSLNNRAPDQLVEKLKISSPIDMILDESVFRPTSAIGRGAFSYLAPRYWNGLPRDLRVIPLLTQFKACLKTYLYEHFQSYKHGVNPYTSVSISQQPGFSDSTGPDLVYGFEGTLDDLEL